MHLLVSSRASPSTSLVGPYRSHVWSQLACRESSVNVSLSRVTVGREEAHFGREGEEALDRGTGGRAPLRRDDEAMVRYWRCELAA